MRLITLSISIEPSYSPKAGQYAGYVKFQDTKGVSETTLHLDAAVSSVLLKVVSEQLVESAKRLASQLTIACIEEVKEGADGNTNTLLITD